jgi:hypothetical protein
MISLRRRDRKASDDIVQSFLGRLEASERHDGGQVNILIGSNPTAAHRSSASGQPRDT